MAISNKATRETMTVEKSKSLSFSVRVEDRLHASILQVTDTCLFTVRPVSYTLGLDDTDITLGTATVVGNGVRQEGVRTVAPGEDPVFVFSVQAAELNLDPELEYWYDVTYVRNGYSMSIVSGSFVVAANVTNRTGKTTYSDTTQVREIVATVHGENTITVTSSMPMPAKGDSGTGSYMVTNQLASEVGGFVTIPVESITAPHNRPVQVGDVIFSSATPGVLATVTAFSGSSVPAATIVTRQVFSKETLKALLDTKFRQTPVGGSDNWETPEFQWTMNKVDVPLPSGYFHRVGDFVFSHSGPQEASRYKKLLISLVEGVGTSTLTVRTKIVFDLYGDLQSGWEELIDELVPKTRKVNGQALVSDIVLNLGQIEDTAVYSRLTASLKSKLEALPSATSLAQTLNNKAPLSHSHSVGEVNGLNDLLSKKVGSTSVDTVWTGTQAEYDALTSKPFTTLYFIRG